MGVSGPDIQYGERLRCGVAIGELLAQVADGSAPPDPDHQRGCRHCRASLAELSSLWTAVHRLAAERVVVPAAFEANVRRRILEPPSSRAGADPLPRPRRWVPVSSGGTGATRVGDTILARLALLAARSVTGVAVRPVSRSNPRMATAGDRVVVAIEIHAPYGDDLVAVADAVRMAVVVQLLAVAGLDDVQVDITITGLVA